MKLIKNKEIETNKEIKNKEIETNKEIKNKEIETNKEIKNKEIETNERIQNKWIEHSKEENNKNRYVNEKYMIQERVLKFGETNVYGNPANFYLDSLDIYNVLREPIKENINAIKTLNTLVYNISDKIQMVDGTHKYGVHTDVVDNIVENYDKKEIKEEKIEIKEIPCENELFTEEVCNNKIVKEYMKPIVSGLMNLINKYECDFVNVSNKGIFLLNKMTIQLSEDINNLLKESLNKINNYNKKYKDNMSLFGHIRSEIDDKRESLLNPEHQLKKSKNNNVMEYATKEQKEIFLDLSKIPCYCCNKLILTTDSECMHIIPKSNGGDYSNQNIVLGCRDCNQNSGVSNPIDYKYIIESN